MKRAITVPYTTLLLICNVQPKKKQRKNVTADLYTLADIVWTFAINSNCTKSNWTWYEPKKKKKYTR